MKRLIALALAVLTSSCGTIWVVTQATGTQRGWDESVAEESVPLPGVDEQLVVTLPLVVATATGSAAAPFALQCRVEQHARSTTYHTAFRYGSRWKKIMVTAFLVEAASAAALILTATSKSPGGYAYGGFFALDAAIVLPIIFIPRKEVFSTETAPVVTGVRYDCPEGAAIAIADHSFPIDAAGRIGDDGEAALAAWMVTPQGSISLVFMGQAKELVIGRDDQCSWLASHDPTRITNCAYSLRPTEVSTHISVPAGTLTAGT